MKNNWTKLIPLTFGDIEYGKSFASDERDKECARQMLNAAIDQRIGYKTFCDTIHEYIKAKYDKQALTQDPVNKDIKHQMRKVRSVKTYFIDD